MLSNDVGLSHESAQPVMNSDGPQERKRRRGWKRGGKWRRGRGCTVKERREQDERKEEKRRGEREEMVRKKRGKDGNKN